MKLDIGSHEAIRPGYVTVDLFHRADIVAPMWAIPIPSGTVDEIHCRYAMEHLSRAQVMPTLREWQRLLKDDGIIIVIVPDLIWCCENFIRSNDTGGSMTNIFGGQSGPGDYHKMGWTEKIMADYCSQAGFVVVRCDRNQDNYFENLVFHIRKK